MGTLADSFESLRIKKMTVRCNTQVVIERLDPQDAEALRRAIDDENISAPSLVKWLSSNGIALGIDSIRRHRRKYCRCWSESA